MNAYCDTISEGIRLGLEAGLLARKKPIALSRLDGRALSLDTQTVLRKLRNQPEVAEKFLLLRFRLTTLSSNQLVTMAQWWYRLDPQGTNVFDFENQYGRRVHPFLVTTYRAETQQ